MYIPCDREGIMDPVAYMTVEQIKDTVEQIRDTVEQLRLFELQECLKTLLNYTPRGMVEDAGV